MRHVAIAGDLVGGIDDDHPFLGFLRQDPGHLPQHGGFAHAGAAQEQDILSGERQVFDDLDRPEDCPAHPAGDAYDLSFPVADGRYPVESALDSGAVVVAEIADPFNHVRQVLGGNRTIVQVSVARHEPGLGQAPQVQYDLQQLVQVVAGPQDLRDSVGQHIEHQVKFNLFPAFPGAFRFLDLFLHRCQYHASA